MYEKDNYIVCCRIVIFLRQNPLEHLRKKTFLNWFQLKRKTTVVNKKILENIEPLLDRRKVSFDLKCFFKVIYELTEELILLKNTIFLSQKLAWEGAKQKNLR